MDVNFDVFGGLLGLGNFYNKGRRMNREKIIQLAHESHLDVYGLGKDYAKFADALERFAYLVAEHEREACAELGKYALPNHFDLGLVVEAAIRARGQA